MYFNYWGDCESEARWKWCITAKANFKFKISICKRCNKKSKCTILSPSKPKQEQQGQSALHSLTQLSWEGQWNGVDYNITVVCPCADNKLANTSTQVWIGFVTSTIKQGSTYTLL